MRYWKYVVGILFIISFIFTFINVDNIKEKVEEERAIYFSYIELDELIKNRSDEEQKNNIKIILDNIRKINFNRIILHVRAFSDSIYKSNYYPLSKSILNNKNEYPNYDILKYFIDEAHKRNIKIDAWVNPYRISNTKELKSLEKESVYYKFNDSKVTEKGIYLNPANKEVQELIVNGIVEIIKKYEVDGIHFDDYFYPDKEIDLVNYNNYLKNGGTLSLIEYRLENVKNLIKNVYSAVKKENNNVLFGIAPEGNIDNCYDNSFLDVKEILSKEGYIDYIMPQIYYGFNNQTRPFKDTLNEWNNLIKIDSIKLIPALAIYKSGKNDKYALSGSDEWITNTDIISREIELSRTASKYKGFSLFSYNYLFNDKYINENNKKELEEIEKIINKKTK